MQKDNLKALLDSSFLSGANQSYIEQLYETYLTQPNSVASHWQSLFAQLATSTLLAEQGSSTGHNDIHHLVEVTNRATSAKEVTNIAIKQMAVQQLIEAFRCYGHLQADIDPLKLRDKKMIAELDPAYHHLTDKDMSQIFQLNSFAFGKQSMKLADLYEALKITYCGSIGSEYKHITHLTERMWLQQRLEETLVNLSFSIDEKKQFLADLIAAQGFERYVSTKFPGSKRFSLEGAEALIPMLKTLIYHMVETGGKELVLGMAHRGRLNVLVNVMGKRPADVFDEFAGKDQILTGSGDVKYHQGISTHYSVAKTLVHLMLAFNPSHLEMVNPVVMGMVRARHDAQEKNQKIVPVTIHGDGAMIAQGIVQETLNMSQTPAYDVGGTIRIVINNQIGFTTAFPKECRSSEYCTDIAKMIQAPIFHVNADDLEAVIFVTRLALDFRNQFQKDVVIDLVCYRRHGHNEADEPRVTQPMMYDKIKRQATAPAIYADKLQQQHLIQEKEITQMVNRYREVLDKGDCVVNIGYRFNEKQNVWHTSLSNLPSFESNQNQWSLENLQALAWTISQYPSTILAHPRVAKIYQDRALMAQGKKAFDWGAAEMLAYATLIEQGFSIRMSGQDTRRGTFFHRHAVIHDQQGGESYSPLEQMRSDRKQSKFQIWDSVLSEAAVLAFEYGYATQATNTLTLWEAQFGDFANGAQVVIDQFISSGEQKWKQACGLVMLLPHGHEGQGPEHSSARLERYLQLCAEQNMQVCLPTTPAQIYHMIRRQIMQTKRQPLIVMSPKSLLRHPLAVSTLTDMANRTFQSVLDEIDELPVAQIKRIILCSGKIYYDLLQQRRQTQQVDVAIIRIEQLYPFPSQAIQNLLARYPQVKKAIWCQEEPQNQGAWHYSYHHLIEILPKKITLHYVGRPAAASTAVGYLSVHQQQQQELINNALTMKKDL